MLVPLYDAAIDEFLTRLVGYVFAEHSCLLIEYEFAEIESVGGGRGEEEDIGPFDGVIDFVVFELRFLHMEERQSYIIFVFFAFRYFHFGLPPLIIHQPHTLNLFLVR